MGERVKERYKLKAVATHKLFSSEAKVLMIYTGGTIGMIDKGHGYEPLEDFFETTLRGLSYFHDEEEYQFRLRSDTNFKESQMITPLSIYNKRVIYEMFELCPLLDSSSMTKDNWVTIANNIARFYAQYDAFILLHGTDTMAYTAAILSFILEGLNKPVIVTGSQIPIIEMRNDALSNLLGALTIAGHYNIPEVTLYFDNKLFRGNRTTKLANSDVAAFESPNLPPLATLGIEIAVQWDKIERPPNEPFRVFDHLDDRIAYIRFHPMINAETILFTGEEPTKAMIIGTYGAGNIPDNRDDILDALKTLNSRGVVLVNVTQCYIGSVDAAYACGQILDTCGVISGGDITREAATTKLSYLLGKYPDDPDQIRRMFVKNLRGEITPKTNKTYIVSTGWKIQQKQVKDYEESEFITGIANGLDLHCGYEIDKIAQALHPTIATAAAKENDVDTLQKLHDQGENLSAFDYEGNTPLHLAALYGHTQVAKFLVRCGIDINLQNSEGQSPLFVAIRRKYFELAKYLLTEHAIVSANKKELATILCKAAAANDLITIRLVIEGKGDINCVDHHGRNFREVAEKYHRIKITSYLKTI